jgi:hypothetical protein
VVLQEFAEQLEADGNLEDAAVAFQACANYRQSMECHLRTANWRQLFAIMHRLGIAEGTEQFVAMAKQAAQTLRANGRHQEAATVLFEYARAPMDAIRSLLDGRSWLEAERHIHRYQLSDGESRSSSDLITSLLVPALAGACGALTNDLEELIAQFERHRQRLIIVRQQNASQLQLPVVAEVEVFPDSQSMATYATTMASTAISSKLSAITACTRYLLPFNNY